MTPTRRSLANSSSSEMGTANSAEAEGGQSNIVQPKHLRSNYQAQIPSQQEPPTSNLQQPRSLQRPRPVSIPSTLDLFSRPRLPIFSAATSEVLRRLTGTPPLPLPDSKNEEAGLDTSLSPVPITSADPSPQPICIDLPPPMITAAEAIKLRREASAKESPGTSPLPIQNIPTPFSAMNPRKRSAARMESGSWTPREWKQQNELLARNLKVESSGSNASPMRDSPSTTLPTIPPSNHTASYVPTGPIPGMPPPQKPRLGRPPKNRDPNLITVNAAKTVKKTRTSRGKNRKRAKDSDDEGKLKASVSDSDSSSEDYTPQTTTTKSGRQVQRPNAFQPPPAPVPSNTSPRNSRPQSGKRVFRRKAGESSVCDHCLRGASPNNNQIVFCDGCNRCWHQHCHDPVIEAYIVREKDKEWFCSGCSMVDEPVSAPFQVPAKTTTPISAPPAPPPPPPPPLPPAPKPVDEPPLDMKGRIGGELYSGQQKRAYLASLPHSHLVSLLLHASSLGPTLPLYPMSLPPLSTHSASPMPSSSMTATPAPLSSATIHSLQPLNSTTAIATTSTPPATAIANKETPPVISVQPSRPSRPTLRSPSFSSDDEEEPLPRPKPGNGIRLPPDSEELDILLDDPYCKTFSHRVRGVQQPAWLPGPGDRLGGSGGSSGLGNGGGGGSRSGFGRGDPWGSESKMLDGMLVGVRAGA